MDEIYELKEKLMKELGQYAQRPSFTKADVELIKYISSAVDHMCNIVAEAEETGEYSGEYSGDGSMRSGRGYSRNDYAMRNSGRSYARGRSNARRDSMGRYSGNRSYIGYANDGDMVSNLREMMTDVPEHLRGDFQRLITKAEQM